MEALLSKAEALMTRLRGSLKYPHLARRYGYQITTRHYKIPDIILHIFFPISSLKNIYLTYLTYSKRKPDPTATKQK